MADLFKELLSSVDSLNEEQVNTLLSRLNEKKAGQEQETSKLVRNLETGKIVACPYCGSATIVKTGKKDGRQRYKCKDCKTSFGDTTGTLHQHSKLTKDQWLGLIKGILLNISLRKIADDIGASVQTVWYNKQKICNMLGELFSEQDSTFNGIVECDEYMVRMSFKGKRDAGFFINRLGRMPKHHRSYSEKLEYLEKNGLLEELQKTPERLERLLTANGANPGRIHEQASILTCKDRGQNLYIRPVCIGRMENQHVMNHLSKRIAQDAIMVTDTYAPYKNFAEAENIQIEQILSERHAKGAFNLGSINALHSRLSAFWPKSAEREPATKYLDLQLMLFWWLEKNKDLSIREQVEMIYGYLSEQYYSMFTWEKLIKRPLMLDTKNWIPQRV